MVDVLKVSNVSKKFAGNDFYSLRNINLTVEEGDIVGLIGKNGSGKSTLLKCITKTYIPTEGAITYRQHDLLKESNMLDDFGIMIETVFYPQLTVEENLNFYLSIHNKEEYKENIPNILKLVELYKHRNRKPGGFSFGMKQRLALAIALVAEPSFLILDEPFVGLDPVGIKRLISILRTWSQDRNVSMIISSHQLTELESICNRYVFIDSGSLSNINQQSITIVIELNGDVERLISDIKSYDVDYEGNKLYLSDKIGAEKLNGLLYTLSKNKLIQKLYPSVGLNKFFE
ncbi:MAG: ABC transporter ATP-binding protein [Ligilactobacillus agilis]|uniref:ABC transporter ATP-binding protein n=1 Tax=Ligilactobacillus agilis TaxID=1601 RepID=UPI002432FC01|nr:ABC transporter ATP-binding protein [Ligilactobacillus agilis]MCI5760934.1 ABC transporter ATP-binding protein [Ligilactobacillus agilis]MDY4065684.1 ABC transporter ATP-binding protein [Ligilactobacillus agilis]